MKKKAGEILKKPLKITFVNPNTEEDMVQAMSGILAYNLIEQDENITFEYSKSCQKQNNYELEM